MTEGVILIILENMANIYISKTCVKDQILLDFPKIHAVIKDCFRTSDVSRFSLGTTGL